MSILVVNCYHRIGFQLIDYLLTSGYEIDGIPEQTSTESEHLSMFLGRNSQFQEKDYGNLNCYDALFVVGTETCIRNVIHQTDVLNRFIIHDLPLDQKLYEQQNKRSTFKNIYLNEGRSLINEHQPLTGMVFEEESVTRDWLDAIDMLLNCRDLPKHVIVTPSVESLYFKDFSLENTLIISENRSQ